MNLTREIEPRLSPLTGEPARSREPAGERPPPATEVDTAAASFLLRATRILASSLDLETTLASIARLSLPRLGCCCIVDLCEGDRPRRVAIVHPDPAQQRLVDRLLSGWPPQRDDPLGVPSAVRTRRSELVDPVTEEVLLAAARSPEHLALLRALQIRSVLTIPLVARGAALGTITYVAQARGGPLSGREVTLAKHISARCALAIDNARLFQHVQTARAMAEEANLAKMRFLSTMSHELRTPLNAIAGYAELLETGLRGPLTEAQLSDVRRIRANERYLLGLVEAVLTYARIDAGRLEFELADVPLASVLEDTATLITPLAERKAITVEGLDDPCGDPELAIHVDREKFKQILVNLLTNAIKFSPPGGSIEVACERTGEHVELRVSDHGVGIAPEHLERIFEPFVQVDEGLRRSYGGTGLGLAISRELARGMGGGLFAESELGRGSTFVLVVPRGRG